MTDGVLVSAIGPCLVCACQTYAIHGAPSYRARASALLERGGEIGGLVMLSHVLGIGAEAINETTCKRHAGMLRVFDRSVKEYARGRAAAIELNARARAAAVEKKGDPK